MSGFDLRLPIPIIINLLKSQTKALTWDWDAFSLFNNPNQLISWLNISFHVFFLLLFSFSCVTLILARRPSPNMAIIRFQFGSFSPHMAVSLVCSIILPQSLFWFMYPAILIFSCLLGWANVKLSALPVWNFQVSLTPTHQHDADLQYIDPQVPGPQVNLAISPDGASISDDDASLLL